MLKKLLLFVLITISITSYAQVLVPLTADPARAASALPVKSTQNGNRTVAALGLPFFDDFARYNSQLDTAKWQTAGGAFVNNTFAIGQPSKNVVTLDGLNAAGQPYNFNNTSTSGPVDTLTSKPIDLSSFQPSDSIYFSFFYQAGGLGEAPGGNSNQLIVEFKKRNGNWTSLNNGVITVNGATPFRQFIAPIPGSASASALSFYHDSFQFRIRSFGFQAGAGDIWNIDYVYLNSGRNRNDTAFADVATSEQPGSLLKPFTALPIRQYLSNPAGFSTGELKHNLVNLNSVFRVTRYKAFASNRQTGARQLLKESSPYLPEFSDSTLQISFSAPTVIDNTTEPRQLAYTFYIVDTAGIEPPITRYNDTISRVHDLSNYFAYDDGTAETGYQLNAGNASATSFTLPLPDTLKAIDLAFLPFKDNQQGQAVRVKVWAPKTVTDSATYTIPDDANVLFEQSVSITYSDRNTFKRVVLLSPIAVSGEIFIGWQQVFLSKSFMGFDRNSNSAQFRYYKTGSVWRADTLQGALMIRAITGGDALTAAPNPVSETATVQLYPNPAVNEVTFTEPIEQLLLIDSAGKQIGTSNRWAGNRLSVAGLPQGLYLVRAKTKTNWHSFKLVKIATN